MSKKAFPPPKAAVLAPSYAAFLMRQLVDLLNSPTTRMPFFINKEDYEWRIVDRSESQKEARRLVSL